MNSLTRIIINIIIAFDVFESPNGSEGMAGRASKQSLENIFNTSKDTEVINYILEHGIIQNHRKGSKEYSKFVNIIFNIFVFIYSLLI